ncbi:S66 family peptidase [Liquorilactobacillus cacaonum]|uniref:Carboxypeptidase n=1 Tax=Liquorilactobacillus cacaonum DSM 21116 TaxID=1423729 RepID=A0A0R2CG61_9LACO|nr:S66 peptidase family protein [Liquorilactobacillus cacaonum]KRM90632.1 carboxypeptidase [Liquorilactobacillus cacaonum DSM 21116]
MIKPKKLEQGDQVAIVSLSSGILGESSVFHQRQLGDQRLRELGLEPVYMKNTLKGVSYLSEHPEARAADLKEAFLNDDIHGIFCAIGGDDTYRLLPYLLEDSDFIDAVQKNPKLFSGFSDTTINHLMFYKLKLQTFYGPNFLNDLAELDKTMIPYTSATLQNYFKNEKNIEIKSSKLWYEERIDFSKKALKTPRMSHIEEKGFEVLNGYGSITGKLLGGCLDSLNDILTSSRYPDERDICFKYGIFPEVSEWKSKILFIETCELKPSPAEFAEMLNNLAKYGIFDVVKAIIVGKPQDNVYYAEYKMELLTISRNYDIPILLNINFGHAYPRTIIPYGCEVKIDFDNKNLTVTDNMLV